MVPDNSQSEDVDLDRTDKLPVLEGASFDDDVADDAVRLDYSPVAKSVKSELRRPSSADLPSLAESVRSVEERIARRNADYEALTRSHEKARAAEAEAASLASGLASELAGARAAADLAQARMEEALRESEQHLQRIEARFETPWLRATPPLRRCSTRWTSGMHSSAPCSVSTRRSFLRSKSAPRQPFSSKPI